MKQSRRASALESVLNIAIGFVVQYLGLLLVLTALGVLITPVQNIGVGVFMTGLSFVRSYALRRLFEHLRIRGILP